MLNQKFFSVLVKSLEDAINLASGKSRFGGCFKEVEGGYLVMWNSAKVTA